MLFNRHHLTKDLLAKKYLYNQQKGVKMSNENIFGTIIKIFGLVLVGFGIIICFLSNICHSMCTSCSNQNISTCTLLFIFSGIIFIVCGACLAIVKFKKDEE